MVTSQIGECLQFGPYQPLCGGRAEPAQDFVIAKDRLNRLEFRFDGIRLHLMLRVARATRALSIGGGVPLFVKRRYLRRGQVELELLRLSVASQEHALNHCIEYVLGAHRDRHGDPEALVDGASFLDQDAHHHVIDLVVQADQCRDSDDQLLLAIAVDSSLALLQPVGIPGQVVVNDRIPVLLQVDALREAIGRDEYPAGRLRELCDDHATLLRVTV